MAVSSSYTSSNEWIRFWQGRNAKGPDLRHHDRESVPPHPRRVLHRLPAGAHPATSSSLPIMEVVSGEIKQGPRTLTQDGVRKLLENRQQSRDDAPPSVLQ